MNTFTFSVRRSCNIGTRKGGVSGFIKQKRGVARGPAPSPPCCYGEEIARAVSSRTRRRCKTRSKLERRSTRMSALSHIYKKIYQREPVKISTAFLDLVKRIILLYIQLLKIVLSEAHTTRGLIACKMEEKNQKESISTQLRTTKHLRRVLRPAILFILLVGRRGQVEDC